MKKHFGHQKSETQREQMRSEIDRMKRLLETNDNVVHKQVTRVEVLLTVWTRWREDSTLRIRFHAPLTGNTHQDFRLALRWELLEDHTPFVRVRTCTMSLQRTLTGCYVTRNKIST